MLRLKKGLFHILWHKIRLTWGDIFCVQQQCACTDTNIKNSWPTDSTAHNVQTASCSMNKEWENYANRMGVFAIYMANLFYRWNAALNWYSWGWGLVHQGGQGLVGATGPGGGYRARRQMATGPVWKIKFTTWVKMYMVHAWVQSQVLSLVRTATQTDTDKHKGRECDLSSQSLWSLLYGLSVTAFAAKDNYRLVKEM